MQVVLVYLPPFQHNSLLKCASQSEITKNLLKPPILRVQGHSRSSMLTFLKSSSPVLVMISSMSAPICNHFHSRRANSGKLTSFRVSAPLSPPRLWGPLYLAACNFITLYSQQVQNTNDKEKDRQGQNKKINR